MMESAIYGSSQVSSLLSNLTVAALLFHAMLGCCWHHAHQCQHALAAEHDEHVVACNGGGECDEHATQPSPADGDRHGDDDCQTAPCTFVATQSNSTAWDLLVEHHDTAAVDAAIAAGNVEVCCGRGSPSFCAGRCMGLRLHLVNQVFLI